MAYCRHLDKISAGRLKRVIRGYISDACLLNHLGLAYEFLMRPGVVIDVLLQLVHGKVRSFEAVDMGNNL